MQHVNFKNSKIILEALAEVLKEEREKNKKSIRILAYEYEIPKSLISRLENGKNEPKLISIWSICEALNIKVSDLLIKIEAKLPKDFSLFED